MPVTRDPELEEFKTRIDLRAFAAGMGYALDRKESWRGSSVMRNQATGDKIIIKRDQDGHMVYFSVRDERDNGSIIDFLQKRRPGSLGQVRQTLRPWIGKSSAAPALFPALERTSKDRLEVERQYRRMQDAPRHPYLENLRGLSPALLSSARFAGRVRIDGRGNAIFPHFDEQGLCGYEIKNKGFTGFSRGGEKGLWFSRAEPGDTKLVLCESAIDAISHAQLFPHEHSRYASIGGQVNPKQPELIRAAIARMPPGSEIVAAMDNDPDGRKLADTARQAFAFSGRSDLSIALHLPEGVGDDWNEVLKRTLNPSSPTALPLAHDQR